MPDEIQVALFIGRIHCHEASPLRIKILEEIHVDSEVGIPFFDIRHDFHPGQCLNHGRIVVLHEVARHILIEDQAADRDIPCPQMLDGQDGTVYRTKAGIGDDQDAQPQLLDEIVEDDMLLLVPAQRR